MLPIGVSVSFSSSFNRSISCILAITFCIVGSACTNQRLLSALEDRYVYECIDDERQAVRSLVETKTLLSQRRLRIYVVDSFDDCIFQYLKENEDIYTISSELVLSCATKEIVNHFSSSMKINDRKYTLGYSCSAKKSSSLLSAFVIRCDLFRWYSTGYTCSSLFKLLF